MPYINVDDVVLAYHVFGNGAPLLLLHGNGEDHTYFQHQIPAFSKKYKVIAMDTRGHGSSTRGTKPLTIDVLADDVAGFIKSLPVPKVHVLGFSDGGNIAMGLAIKYPELVMSLILNGINTNPLGLKNIVRRQIALQYYFRKYFTLSKNKRRKIELLELMLQQPNITDDALQKIKCPALIIMGENDMIIKNHGKHIARMIQNGSYVEIKGGDHFNASKKAESFNEIVMNYLDAF